MPFAPNTTPTPNWLYNGEMKKMNETELKIVLIVTRQTLGWYDEITGDRKKQDRISQKQFMEKSGKSNRAVSTAIENCLENGWIEAYDIKGNPLHTPQERKGKKIIYRLGNMFLSKINPSRNNPQDKKPVKKVHRTCEESSQVPVKKVHISKETLKKETLINSVAHATGWDFEKTLKEMKTSKRRDLQIIALYWEYKGYKFTNRQQFQPALKRELRPAQNLVGYSDEDICGVMDWLIENSDIKWTLETIHKMIDEDLSNCEPIFKNKGRLNG